MQGTTDYTDSTDERAAAQRLKSKPIRVICVIRGSLLFLCFSSSIALAAWPAPRSIDEDRLAKAGLRVIEAEHATLVTDFASSPEVDVLPRLVDRALPHWQKRFRVDAKRLDDWRLRIYLIENEAKFRALGLWPNQSQEFQHGLSLGYEVWVRKQPTDYYQRHLLLHEATHSFMSTLLGSCGPGWYMEGMAELCGSHTWDPRSRELRLAVMPTSRAAAPHWGRVALIRNAVEEGKALTIDAVMKIDNRVVLPSESYAWVWALSMFLDQHPAYRDRFRQAPGWVLSENFDRRFRAMYAKDRAQLDKEWRLFITSLDYGHDIASEAIDFQPGQPLAAGGSQRQTLHTDRGWQSTGIAVTAGQPIHITASGRYVIAHDENIDGDGAPWPCEPGGVTLDYHAGRPLGELLATVDSGDGAFTDWRPIGLAADYTPPATGTLYLRVNDAPNALADNEGTVEVRVQDASNDQ
jgi:hypothetical protein